MLRKCGVILWIGTTGRTGVIHSPTAGYFGATATLAATYNWQALCQSCHHTTRQLLESPLSPSLTLSRLPAGFPSWYGASGRCYSGVRVGTYERKIQWGYNDHRSWFPWQALGCGATWYRTSSPCHLHNTEELLMDFYTAESLWRCREDPRGRITEQELPLKIIANGYFLFHFSRGYAIFHKWCFKNMTMYLHKNRFNPASKENRIALLGEPDNISSTNGLCKLYQVSELQKGTHLRLLLKFY